MVSVAIQGRLTPLAETGQDERSTDVGQIGPVMWQGGVHPTKHHPCKHRLALGLEGQWSQPASHQADTLLLISCRALPRTPALGGAQQGPSEEEKGAR